MVYGLALAVSFSVAYMKPEFGNIAIIVAMAVGILPLARRALIATFKGAPFSIETLMVIASIGAAVIGAVHEAATVILLYLIGEVLETLAARRAQMGVQKLVDLVPQDAHLETDSGVEVVAAADLIVGNCVVVGAGERMPADGVVTAGVSDVDESPLTGESLPKRKDKGATVLAGSVNGEGVLRVQVTKDADQNAIARVAHLVKEAQSRKAPVQRIINRFAHYYTPAIVFVAVLVAILPPLAVGEDWETWIYRALALLLIGCPCALVISTPAALASALSAGAGRGLLVKGGDVLEALAKVDTVAFDKTGTLTKGCPQVTDVVAIHGDEARLLSLAAGLSVGGSHPIAKAVISYVRMNGIDPDAFDDVTVIPGQGVQGRIDSALVMFGALPFSVAIAEDVVQAMRGDGKTVSQIISDGEVQGYIATLDTLREDALEGVQCLQAAGMRTVMLTGDTETNTAQFASALKIDFHAGLMPEDKMFHVRNMQSQGHAVVKIGDGINDAPALATADVGIAFGNGTDVALETADAASLYSRVTDVLDMVILAKQTMRNIHQNIGIALGLKCVFLVTTIVGLTGLWPAILADTGATVLVTANALRLLGQKGYQSNRRIKAATQTLKTQLS